MPMRLAILLFHFAVHAHGADLTITPGEMTLRGAMARQRVIVSGTREGKVLDLTREAKFHSETPTVVGITADGVVKPAGDGTGTIVAVVGEKQARVVVKVSHFNSTLPITLERDVIPVLTRAGCNAGACHGKQRGQGGFQLSLLGFDADFDLAALTREGRGRRIFPASPSKSLLLMKPTAEVPHGGGKKLQVGDDNYNVLLRWIESGTPRQASGDATLERVAVEPGERSLMSGGTQQLIVSAYYSDKSREDVTHLANFSSSDSVIAGVNASGLVKAGPLPGEAAVMARFQGKFALCYILIPRPATVEPEVYAKLPRYNFIDSHVWDRLKRLNLTPSEAASESTLLRRTYLDVIGRLPTPDEVREYLKDSRNGKQEKLVDALLARPEYADFWANKWADLLRPNPYRVGVKAVYNLDAFLRESFRQNKPYDQFVREIVTAKGSTFRNGAVVFFRDRREPDEITTAVSQLFLGVRLECAKCHHHPFEVWGQDDFYSFAAFFSKMGRKGNGISPPISGGEEFFFTGGKGKPVKHPVSGKEMTARPLLGTSLSDDERDPREALADWMTAKDNPFFAKVIVNRVWADLMGRGLVEPVDDLRATNPPTNPALLDALADDFRKNGYDLKKLIRTIATSYVYRLSTRPTSENALDGRNHTRAYRQRLRGEVLLDAVCDITSVPETFQAMPPGARAMQLWTFRSQSLFLDSFGRPDPNQDPPCERLPETTVVQVLHLMNAPGVHGKVTSDAGRAAELAKSKKSEKEIVEELYLLVYSRQPTEEELKVGLRVFARAKDSRRQATEDLLWALLNTPEFVFRD